MTSSRGWGGVGCAVGLAVAAAAGGCGSDSTTTATATTTGSGGTGGSGSTTGAGGASATSTTSTASTTTASAAATGTGGSGGSVGAPFTSLGGSSYEAQPSIMTDGKGSVVVAWIGFFPDNTSSIGYAISRDDGVTFTAPSYIETPSNGFASDPHLAVDGAGHFALAWLGFHIDAANPDEHIYVSTLDDVTETFTDPVNASDDGTSTKTDYNKPEITVDGSGDLLLTWADFTAANAGGFASLVLARSSDGVTFDRTTITSDASFGNLAYLCVDASAGPAAPLYLVHLANGELLTLRHSTDKGATWQTLPVPPATNVVFQDISCAVHGSDLWLTYASGAALFTPGFNTPGDAVSVLHSASGGATFDPPVTASDGAAGTQYLFPRIVRSGAGSLEIEYYQGEGGKPATLMHATSKTGATWTTAKLADAGTFTLDRSLANWLGDYLGIAATSKALFTSYTENSKGKAHIGFTTVALP